MSDKPLEHRGEYFDVTTTPTPLRYGDVNNNVKSTPLPADVAARFNGKVMAITGWESNTEQATVVMQHAFTSDVPLSQLDVNTGKWVTAKCTEATIIN